MVSPARRLNIYGDANMQINTLECGARQIVLDPLDNYEILFRNHDENEVMLAFHDGESHVMAVIGYDSGIREEQYRFSVKSSK
jgi:hypothetical protein